MINLTKKLNFMLIAICCISQTIESSYICDQNGKTELMNYVKQQDIIITMKKHEIKRLYDNYFTFNQEKRIWTTDEDVIQYRNVQNAYNLLIDETIEKIKIMVLNGANLQVHDRDGKSVSDYCNTKEIYTALKDFGAPLSLEDNIYLTIISLYIGIIIVNMIS